MLELSRFLDRRSQNKKNKPDNNLKSVEALNYRVVNDQTTSLISNTSENLAIEQKHGFEETDEFKRAFALMESDSQFIFITGKAGTGKSTLIDYFRKYTEKNVAYLAPTGIAALHIGGKTIHSLFQFPPKIIRSETIEDNKYKSNIEKIFRELDTLVIDEISMTRVDLIDGIDYILKRYRDPNMPFGGVQMIFIGDLYQLQPVVKDDGKTITVKFKGFEYQWNATEYFEYVYNGVFFFNAKSLKNVDYNYFELTRNFRQNDEKFINLLNSVRINEMNDMLFSILNKQCMTIASNIANDTRIFLCTTNDTAKKINDKKLKDLKSQIYEYNAVMTGKFANQYKPVDYPVNEALELKEKAQVMMVKNDPKGRWVNGTIGTIEYLDNDRVDVKIGIFTYTMGLYTWEAIEYVFDYEKNKLVSKVAGTFTQYPIKLAWAITIHKSQGQTFEKVAIDLGNEAFAAGQTYVALSRCKTLEGIILTRPVEQKDIKVDQKIVDFENRIKNSIPF
ncbi:hypothetical protein AGMMS50212_13460 [Spirochaetia bacterium]|nr:hypothetical protein AGMMS50212_13460 [Spirochaetia bacterium]